jgi:hypothetical protein
MTDFNNFFRLYFHVLQVMEHTAAQWFDIGTSIFFCFVNEICSLDIYLSIKA